VAENDLMECRTIFEKNMAPVFLSWRGDEPIALEAVDHEGRGFKGSYLVLVSERILCDNHVWSSSTVRRKNDGTMDAVVFFNPKLFGESATFRKFVFAYEFIEVMLSFGPHPPRKELSEDEDLVLLQDYLGGRSVWQESQSKASQIHQAVKQILVSRESLNEVLHESFDELDLRGLRKKIKASPVESLGIFCDLTKVFAEKKHVCEEVVKERLMEVLYESE
jgi:hypothetical protein